MSLTPGTMPHLAKMFSDFILKLELKHCMQFGNHRLFDSKKWSEKEMKKIGL